MPDVWVAVAVAVAVVAALGLYRFAFAPSAPAVTFADGREEQLTRRMARAVGCSLAQALPSVRRELRLAPGQSDETLLKRAVYHYRRETPEGTCSVYRDRAPG